KLRWRLNPRLFPSGGRRDGHRISGRLFENRSDVLIRWPREQQRIHFLHQSPQSLSHNSRFSLAQKSRIESCIASPRNRTLGGCQASENIALARDDTLGTVGSS